jgi:glycosyltransferase involved in cell wall biosynthesis
MRIALCDYSGHPFQLELSRCLAARGHSVLHLHFAEFQTPKAALLRRPDDPPTFDVAGISLGAPFEKQRFLRRRAQEIRVGRMMADAVVTFGADLVVGCNMPLDAQAALRRASAKASIAFVFWLQDIYSAAIRHYLDRRFGRPGAAVGRYYAALEGRLLRTSDAVVAISPSFVALLRRWGVAQEKIAVIPNWAPLSEIGPAARDDDWLSALELTGKTIALYSGTLGLKHDPAPLLELARTGRERDLAVLVVSEGPAADRLAAEAAARGLDNLILLPFQPMERYARLLGCGDVLLAMIEREASKFSVPSKILSYLAAGKPIVAAIPHDNDAARTIEEAEAGLVTEPGDNAAFVTNVLTLAADPALRGRMGQSARAFAEQRFSIAAIADTFETLFAKAVGRLNETQRR